MLCYTRPMSSWNFCPRCGAAYPPAAINPLNQPGPRPPLSCQSCHFTMFHNLVTTASAIIIHEQKLLLVRRAVDPHTGMLDVPGGYCEENEHPESTVVRECQEELGVQVVVDQLFGVYSPSEYVYQDRVQYNCDLFYTCHLTDPNVNLRPNDDVANYEWFSLDALPAADELAFASGQQLIRDLTVAAVTTV